MSVYDLGAPVRSVWAGAPATGPYSVAITRPDGTAFTTPAVTPGPPVSVTFVPDMAGRWRIRWTASGGVWSDVVDIWPEDPKFIISVDDAKAALNLSMVPEEKLNDLRLYIAAATPVIEDIVGPLVVRTETQHVEKLWKYAALNYKPSTVVSVVYDDLTAVPADLYSTNLPAGLLTFTGNGLTQGATITYTVGTAIVPQNVRLATRELVRHWWQQGQQKSVARGGMANPTDEAYTFSGFAVPKRVIEQCGPNKQIGGFG